MRIKIRIFKNIKVSLIENKMINMMKTFLKFYKKGDGFLSKITWKIRTTQKKFSNFYFQFFQDKLFPYVKFLFFTIINI